MAKLKPTAESGDPNFSEVLAAVENSLQDHHYFALQKRRYEWLLKHVVSRVPRGSKIADVGATPGHISLALRELGYEVVAFDYDPEHNHWEDRDDETVGAMLRRHQVTVEHFDVEVREPTTVPFADGEFDAVIFTEILEHIYAYPFASVRKVANLLRPGGHLFLTTPNRGYLPWRFVAFFGGSIDTAINLLEDCFPPHMRHVWLYTRRECEQILRKARLVPVLSEVRSFHIWTTRLGPRSCLPYWKPNSIRNILKLPLALMLFFAPELGSSICVIAIKQD